MTLYEKGMQAVREGKYALKCGKRQAQVGENIIARAERKYGFPKALANDNEKE